MGDVLSGKLTWRGARPNLPAGPFVSLAYKVPLEKRGELLALLSDAFPFYERPGGIRMGLYESRDEPGVFLEIVAYASEADRAADEQRLDTPEYQEILGRWHALMEGELQVMRLEPVELGTGDLEIAPASVGHIEATWHQRWGLPIHTADKHYWPGDVQGLGAFTDKGLLRGLVSWVREGDAAEIVSMDALVPRRGIGTRLLEALETQLFADGVRSLRAMVSNDNGDSTAFFQRHGYRLVEIHRGAVERIRQVKPSIPERGKYGIPIDDLWELRKER
ncbi:MAG: GNAT family N-acetyltransferase [Myxococcales bacterium]|jgi:RimJ/RimL family protein N-acetyltransferase